MARTQTRARISGRARLAGTAKLPQTGTWKASETGAREAAELKQAFQGRRGILNAATDTKKFERKIQGKKGY